MEGLFILLGLLLFTVSYLFVPAIFCLRGKELSKAKILTITIINGTCITLLYSFLYNDFATTIGMVAIGIPWSCVAYWLMKKKCFVKQEKYIPKYSSTPIQVEKMSLSPIGEIPKKYGNFNIYGDDIRLQTEEPKTNDCRTTKKECDTVDIILRLKTDEEFYTVVKTINEFDKEKLSSLLRFLK